VVQLKLCYDTGADYDDGGLVRRAARGGIGRVLGRSCFDYIMSLLIHEVMSSEEPGTISRGGLTGKEDDTA